MSWLHRYYVKLYVRNSIWILPLLGVVVGLAIVHLVGQVDRALDWKIDITVDNGRAVIGMVAASMFNLVVVVSSAVLVTVQLASSQLTPRIISIVYRNSRRKSVIGIFLFMFTFSVGAFVRIETGVPLLTTYIAAYGFLLNLGLFLYFIDTIGKALRPSSALRTVALEGREVVHAVYWQAFDEQRSPSSREQIRVRSGEPAQTLTNVDDGVVLAFHVKGLVSLAERHNCVIELVPQVGDYVASGDGLFRVFGATLPAQALRNSIAIGQERTLDQDPMYAFRILVDIASKALSPAINDPTTAVLAIDQLHHLLRDVGNRYLTEGQETDRSGRIRLVYRTPKWEDFVHLAVTEIRQYGRDSIQVMRRLRAMLENLIETLPAERGVLLKRELQLVGDSSQRTFVDLDDQNLAQASDLQGIGGSGVRHHEFV